MSNLLVPHVGEELFTAYVEILNQCLVPVDQILKDPHSMWFMEQSRKRLVRKSLSEACDELEQTLGAARHRWHWGKIHALTLAHALSRIEQIRPLLSIGPLPSPGDGTTIKMGFYRYSNPYEHTIGASMRMIIDLNDQRRSGFILCPGQSGHLSSAHWKDQMDLWKSGQRISIWKEMDDSRWEDCLILEPPPPGSS